jgi:hypothetical protein
MDVLKPSDTTKNDLSDPKGISEGLAMDALTAGDETMAGSTHVSYEGALTGPVGTPIDDAIRVLQIQTAVS